MPRSPSIVPDHTDRDVYLVLDDFGRLGKAWRETDEAGANRSSGQSAIPVESCPRLHIYAGSRPYSPV
jgi:hypothetical protein